MFENDLLCSLVPVSDESDFMLYNGVHAISFIRPVVIAVKAACFCKQRVVYPAVIFGPGVAGIGSRIRGIKMQLLRLRKRSSPDAGQRCHLQM